MSLKVASALCATLFISTLISTAPAWSATTTETAAKTTPLTRTSTTKANGDLINFTYRDAEITKVIEDYSKATGQQFVVNSGIKGKVTILNTAPITKEEAFNQMSAALAGNGIGISTQGTTMFVDNSRSIQRNLIPVVTELPQVQPVRMYTWIIQLHNADADDVNKQLRILTSRDGELVPYTRTNQILVSDWSPNLQRIAEIIKVIDAPVAKRTTK